MKPKPRYRPNASDQSTNAGDIWRSVPDVVYRIRAPEGTIEFVSPAFERLTGWTPGEWVGRSFVGLVHPDDVPRAVETFESSCRGETPAPYELRMRTKAGDYLVGEFHSSPFVENGKIVGETGIARDVTDRARAVAARRAAEDRFHALADGSNAGIWHITPDGHTLYANPMMCRLLEIGGPEELAGQTYHGFFTPESLETMRAQHVRRPLGVASTYEVALIGRRGTRRDLLVSGAPVFAPDGSLQSLIGTFIDITERRRARQVQDAVNRIAEAALSASSPQGLFAAIHQVVGELMPAKNLYIALYDRASDMITFPYSVDEFDAARAPRKRKQGMTEYVLRTEQAVFASPEVLADLERRGEVVLSGTRSVDWVGVPLRTADQTIGVLAVQSYVAGTRYSEADKDLLQFVSTQVAMAIERQRAEEALRQSEAKYRSLVEHATYGIYRSTVDGHMVAANPALVAMLGYASEEELLACDMARNIYAEPSDRERLIAQHRDAERIEGVNVLWRRKDGTTITVRLSRRPVRRADGAIEAFDMLVEDVTERRRLEEQLRQAQKMEAVGQLAGGIAHDFNNLLTAVITSCDLLSAELPPGSAHAEDLETICGAAERGAELTRRLLAFSRRQPLELRKISLAAVANGFFPVARRAVPEDIDLAMTVEVPETTVNADSGAVE